MMSKCPHCGSFSWELHTESPIGSNFKINFVRCSICKVPVGTMEFFNLHSSIEVLQKKIDVLERTVSTLAHSVAVVDENVRRLFHK